MLLNKSSIVAFKIPLRKLLIVRKSGRLEAAQPHKCDVLTQRPGDTPTCIDLHRIAVKQYFDQHPGMIRTGTASFITTQNSA